MGKKLDALLGRTFKTSKFKATVNVAVSRLAILKNQRQARFSISRSDVVQLLNVGHHERALLRVEQVIKEQNMLDVFVMIEGYCLLLIERVNLVQQERVCPDELKEAVSSLIYAATRCGEFPELQEIRALFTSRFGKEFANRAIELRNNCGVNPKMIQKLSTKTPTLENRLKLLKEIASENNIVLEIEDVTPEEKLDANQNQNKPKTNTTVDSSSVEQENNLSSPPEEVEGIEGFSDPTKARRRYRDVADAAQVAFESAAYAAAAARAAVELSRFESRDPDDPNSPNPRPRKVSITRRSMKSKFQTGEIEDANIGLGFENIHPIQNFLSESEEEEMRIENKMEQSEQSKNATKYKRSLSTSSSDSAGEFMKGTILSSQVEGQTKPSGMELVFDETDDETGNKRSGIPSSRIHDMGFDTINEVLNFEKSNIVKDEDLSEKSSPKIYYSSHRQFPMKSQAALKVESRSGKPKAESAEGSRKHDTQRLSGENKPISMRTKQTYRR